MHNVLEEPVIFRSVGDFPNPDALIPQAVPWILAAGCPYYDWLCGGRGPAQRTVVMWMRQLSSEVSIRRVQFLELGSKIAGGVIGLSGAEVKSARTADINSYWATLDVGTRGSLIEKLSQGLRVFAPVSEDEYYISKIGLTRAFQGKGLARVLLKRCLDQGNALGYSTFRADVEVKNQPSLRIFLSMGFEIFYTGQSDDGALRYHGMRFERKNM